MHVLKHWKFPHLEAGWLMELLVCALIGATALALVQALTWAR
jgi:hypothetical protein